jgi:hypothetical protein
MRLLAPRRTGPERTAASAGAAPAGGAEQFAGMTAGERRQALVVLVRKQSAAVLGHGSASALDVDRGFVEMGFDSLTAVELRNRLAGATGLRLPATVIFDCPTPTDLARRLDDMLAPAGAEPADEPAGPPETAAADDDGLVDDMDVDELIRAVNSGE